MNRRLLGVAVSLCLLGGAVFASDPIQDNSPHTLGQHACDVTTSVLYYAGTSNIYPADNFYGSTNVHWRISVVPNDSWYSLYNNGLFNEPGFEFASNGKPINQGPITAVKSTSAASIGSSIPGGYQRSQIAAQIVYHLKRRSYAAGPFPNPIYYTPVGGGVINTTIMTSPNASSTQQDNECRNMYVGFCGDNVVDNGSQSTLEGTPAQFSNYALAGGEACDDGNTNNDDACTNDCTWNTPVCGTVHGQTYYDDQHPPLGDEINANTPGLCPAGQTVVNFQYNPAQGTRTWNCGFNVPGAPLSSQCEAFENYCGDDILQIQYGEECDGAGQAQCSAGETCNQTTCGCDQLPIGVCGSADGEIYYAFADNGTALNQNSPGLCPAGQTVISWSWNQATHTFSRNCLGEGGPSLMCDATESYCGDGIQGEGIGYTNQEQCDDGNTDPFDDCLTYDQGSPVCLLPYCGDGYVQLHLGEECDDGNTMDGDGCESDCTLPEDPGICGGQDGQAIYDFDNNGDALNANSPGLCANGTVDNFVYNPVTHSWSWSCLSPNGGENDVCNATELWCGNDIVEANQGEQCDGTGQAQCGAGQTCSQCACISNPSDGVCGGQDGQAIYDFDNNGDALNANSPGLCANGTIANFVYNPTTHSRSWTCNGLNGGQNDICNATELWCGNNIVEANQGEQCDGTGQAQCGAGETCNQCGCSSNPVDGICGSENGQEIYDFDNNGDALNANSPGLCADGNVSLFFYNSQTHAWSWQCVGFNGGQTDFCAATELWCGNNIVEANQGEQCDGTGQAQCGAGEMCNQCGCSSNPVDGICGSENGQEIYDFDNNGDALNANSLGLCANGTIANFVYNPTTHSRSWTCNGVNGGQNDVCTATELWCGNNIVEANQGEQCDGTGQAQCPSSGQTCIQCDCTSNPLDGICGPVDGQEIYDFDNNGDALNPNSPGLCANGTIANFVYNPITHSWSWTCVGGNGGETDFCNATELWCGNGLVEQGEMCDDGNQTNGDGCDNDCTFDTPSSCEYLSVNTIPNNVPLEIFYSCVGNGSQVEVQLFSSTGVLLQSAQTASGSFLVTTPDSYSVICSYDDITSPACQKTVDAGGYCEDLTATLLTGQTYEFTCEGVGSDYLLVITDEQQQVIVTASATGDFTFTYTFTQSGSYSAICFVDGVSNNICDDQGGPSGFPSNPGGGKVGIKKTPTTYVNSGTKVNTLVYGSSPVDSVLSVLQKQAFKKQMNTFVQNLKPADITVVTTTAPQVIITTLAKQLDKTVTTIQDQLTNDCYNSCLEKIVIGDEPDDAVCVLTTIPTNTIVNASSLTVTGSCAFSGVQGITGLDCGNGVMLTGSEGTCIYTGQGSWTMSCQLDGAAFPGCTKPVTLKSGGSSGGSSSGGGTSGGGNPSSIKCGNGKIDPGEQCDDGIKNGKKSICTTLCTLKGISPETPTTDDPPKCAFIDPPSIQLGEILPFWRGIEDDDDVTSQNLCTAAGEGKIPRSSLRCHFTVAAPDGTTYTVDESCTTDKLKSVGWYDDLQKDLGEKFSPKRGKSFIDTSKRSAQVYGEYTITLDKITYALCVETAPATATSPASYAMAFDQAYEGRVCQFNFAVTTPYLIQKGTSLSSFSDDVYRLRKFLRIDGRSVLNVSSISLLEQTTRSDMFATMKKSVYAAANKAVQAVDVAHPLGRVNSGFKKVPSQELYVIDTGFTLRHAGKITPFNNGKPTTIIVRGAVEVRLVGSLAGNLLIVAPEGTITFVNEQCDATDTIEATLVAANIDTSLAGGMANRSLTSKEWCTDGKLVIRGVVVSEQRSGIANVRAERRSTLNNWFDGTDSKAEHIYLGASLRIESKPSVWSLQPPLAKDNALFITKPGHGSADEIVLPLSDELLEALLPLFVY